jgi:hypothetical protein
MKSEYRNKGVWSSKITTIGYSYAVRAFLRGDGDEKGSILSKTFRFRGVTKTGFGGTSTRSATTSAVYVSQEGSPFRPFNDQWVEFRGLHDYSTNKRTPNTFWNSILS